MARSRRRRAAVGDRPPAAERVEAVLKREAAGLLAYLERRVRPREEAADLLSETMLVAWRRADVVPESDQEARMWLFGVARHTLSTHRRGQLRRDALAGELRSELVARPDVVGLHGREEDDPRVERVRSLVAELPETDREIFSLVIWDGFALTEVAELLGMPAGTVRSRYSRARAAVRARIEQD